MQKIICSQQVRLPQKTLKAMLVSSIIVGLLLPLSAISAPTDDNTLSDGATISDTYADGKVVPVSIDKEEVREVNNSTIQDKKSEIPDIAPIKTPSIESPSPSINTKQEINKPPTAAADRYIDAKEEAVTAEVAETPVATTSQSTDKEVADKEPSWMSMEYLLGGGLLLLLLGGGLLLFSKINELKNDNKNLAYNNANLKRQSDKQTKLANSAQEENKKLVSDIELLKSKLDEQHPDPVEIDNELSSAWLADTPELIIIDDLNKSDRTQLASIFENWLRTNRGNTDVRDLIPEDIQRKLKDSEYLIEFWGQSDGLDSVEITKNTTRTAIISLIKHDNQGYAYCYKKPNSMSALWKNKAWYDVKKVNGTLKTMGESLETT